MVAVVRVSGAYLCAILYFFAYCTLEVDALSCTFQCDDPVTECEFFVDSPKCEVANCTSKACRYEYSNRINKSTLNESCPEIETIATRTGDCDGCYALCEAPIGRWICDIKIVPKCVPQCERPVSGCTSKMIRSYENDPGVSISVYFAWISGSAAFILLLLLFYFTVK